MSISTNTGSSFEDLIRRIEVTYLPHIKNAMDDVDLNELNEGYRFAIKCHAKSFATYSFLIPFLDEFIYDGEVPICGVVDFPYGTSSSEQKLIEAAFVVERAKKLSSASSVDIVLNPKSYNAALNDILCFSSGKLDSIINIKPIIELGVRPEKDIKELIKILDTEHSQLSLPILKIRYLKTNTGRMNSPTFEEKMQQVKWLRRHTTLPLKISGGINTLKEIQQYEQEIEGSNIYGVGYNKVKTWVGNL